MKKSVIATVCASALLLSSCQSYNQFAGVVTGASVGGMFGSAIGAVADGPHGYDTGRLLGMAIGGIIGAAATAPKTQDGNYRNSDVYGDYGYEDYRENNSYSPYANIQIVDMRFVDENNNNALDAGEHAKLVFVIRNTGSSYVYDIAPVITVTGTKQIYLSPTAKVSELGPGKAVRYTSEVIATNKLKNGTVEFSIGLSDGNRQYTMTSFQLRTRR